MRNRDILFVIRMRNEARRALSSLNTDLRSTAKAAQQASVNSRKYQGELKRLNTTGQQTSQIFSRLRGLLAGIGLGLGVAQGVRTLADFSQGMSTVQAITQATDEQFKVLESTAKDLGATTRFTATQASEGMLFLARAGFNVNQTLESVDDTLLLAQAGALDLGRAADIASNVLTGFRLETDQATRIVDVLAFAANNANTNVEQLGTAMKFVAPVAAGMGVDVEEAAAAVAALSDAGLQGSLAGTGLRRVLSELESPSVKTRQILTALGVSTNEVRISQVGLTQAMQRLAEAGVDTGTALEIFGDRGGPAFEVLSSSIPKVVQMNRELQNAQGTAERIATVMDDNFNGALLRTRSALEAVILELGAVGAESIATQFFNSLAQLLRTVAANADTLANVLITVAVVLTARLVPALRAGIANMLGLSGAAGTAAASFRLLRTALNALGLAVIFAAVERVQEGVSSLSEEVAAGVTKWNLLGEALGAIGDIFADVLDGLAGLGGAIATFLKGPRFVGQAIKEARAASERIGDAFTKGFQERLNQRLRGLAERSQLEQMFRDLKAAAEASNLPREAGESVGQAAADGAASQGAEAGRRFTNEFFEGTKEFGGFNNFAEALENVVSKFAPGIAAAREQEQALKVLDVAARASDRTLRDLGVTREQLTEITEKARRGLAAETGEVTKAVREAEKRLQVLRVERTEREVEERVLTAVNAAKEKGEKIDARQVQLLRERLTLAQQIEAREAIGEDVADTIRDLEQQAALLGVHEQQRRRVLAVQKLQEEARKQGLTDISAEIALLEEAFARLEAAEARQRGDIFAGARQGIRAFIDEAEDLNARFSEFSNNTLNSLSDSLTEFIQTGKFNFADFANSVLADLQRIASQRIVAEIAGSLLGGGAGGGGGRGDFFSTAAGFLTSLFHSGGVVGRDGVPALADAAQFVRAQRFQTGGRVSGRGRDTVPILAAPGEVVLTEQQASDLRRALGTRDVGGVGGAAATSQSLAPQIIVQAPITVNARDAQSFLAPETQGQVSARTARSISRANARNN